MSRVETRLKELGYSLPAAPSPAAAYVPCVVQGEFVFTAGQLPMVEGRLAFAGKVGNDLTLEQGQQAARICALNALAVVKAAIGDLDRVTRVVKLTGWVNSSADFTQQHLVMNGASELLLAAFGERGKHARAAVGTNTLPLGAATELELIVAVEPR